MTIVSGICPVEHLGAGRVIRFIESELPKHPDITLAYASNKSGASSLLKKKNFKKLPASFLLHACRRARLYQKLSCYAEQGNLVLMHFQEIGFDWCLRLLCRRKIRKPVWFFLFDSAFFCRKSYNHIDGDCSECLRCLSGNFAQADYFQCPSFPRKSKNTISFLTELRKAACDGRAAFFAQNDAQKHLAECHFGPSARVVTSGVWTDDFDNLLLALPDERLVRKSSEFDVVFHANITSAKGFGWALQLARSAPAVRFLFPAEKPGNLNVTDNCTFLPLRWNTGLSEQVSCASVTLLPSLWSAPVEGALLKSILVARKVAVADVDSAYSSELPGDLVLKLPLAPQEAATVLNRYLSDGKNAELSSGSRTRWIRAFQQNRNFVKTMQDVVSKNLPQ